MFSEPVSSTAERIEELVQKEAKKLSEGLTAGMLRDYVQELEEHKLKLILTIKEYREKYEQQKADQADIYFYLNKKLDDNYEVISKLEQQIMMEQADRENAEKNYEKRIEELKGKLVHEEARYIARVNDLEERLQALKEFGDQKDESKQAEQVSAINRQIIERDRELRKDLDLAVSTEEEMAKRLVMYQRLIRQLNEKIAVEERSRASEVETLHKAMEEKDSEVLNLKNEIEELQSQINEDERRKDSFWSLVYDAYYTTSSTGPKGSKWNNTNKQTPSSAGGGGSSRGGARAGRSAGTEAGFSSPSFPGSGRSSRAVSVTSDFVFANRAIKGSAEELEQSQRILAELFEKALTRNPFRFKQLLKAAKKGGQFGSMFQPGSLPPLISGGGSTTTITGEDSLLSIAESFGTKMGLEDEPASHMQPTAQPGPALATGISSWDSGYRAKQQPQQLQPRRGKWWERGGSGDEVGDGSHDSDADDKTGAAGGARGGSARGVRISGEAKEKEVKQGRQRGSKTEEFFIRSIA
eukprot:gene3396-4212_t